MSCNGCRVLRKGCGESCILRTCLQWIESAEAQGHATVFVAKFFGRAGLMNFISSVPEPQRAGLFQSLLFEACGRTVNPVNGAVGLLWSGNWHVCRAAVETVLRGETLQPLPNLQRGAADVNYCRESGGVSDGDDPIAGSSKLEASDLDLCLSSTFTRRPGTPSEGSVTTTTGSRGDVTAASAGYVAPPQLLNLFV